MIIYCNLYILSIQKTYVAITTPHNMKICLSDAITDFDNCFICLPICMYAVRCGCNSHNGPQG